MPARDTASAHAQFRRSMRWITLGAVVMVGVVLWYLSLFGPLRLHMVIATVAGVFVSTLLGCGLFAAAFFSDRSGHDDAVDRVGRGPGER